MFFEDSGERVSSESGGKGTEGAPPAWPEEAARQAKRVIQSTLFPEFEDFDVVSNGRQIEMFSLGHLLLAFPYVLSFTKSRCLIYL